jgi:NifU-like protein involved in Fe-S cluster formation
VPLILFRTFSARTLQLVPPGPMAQAITFRAFGAERGRLTIFAGVREFPVRVKCATLSWHTMHAALNEQEKVSTE